MLKIGITGGIGSGKSTVCKIFAQLEIPIYSADIRAKQLMVTDEIIRTKLSQLFGSNIYNQDRTIDRQRLARIIFNDNTALQQVNQIVHPRVHYDFENWTQQFTTKPYVLKEAAILFESGAHQSVDQSIIVLAPESLRIERVTARDNTDAEAVKARIRNQWPDEKKIKLANFVIHNDEQLLLIPQVLELHQKLLNQEENKN